MEAEDTGPYPFTPDWCIAPAETLREWMDEHGMSATVLAVSCVGRERKAEAEAAINAVLAREPLTKGIADLLARGTWITARFWLGLEHNYRAGLAAGLKDVSES